ncbi:hypothetical protein V2J09_008053 [Rumex salicifolius]
MLLPGNSMNQEDRRAIHGSLALKQMLSSISSGSRQSQETHFDNYWLSTSDNWQNINVEENSFLTDSASPAPRQLHKSISDSSLHHEVFSKVTDIDSKQKFSGSDECSICLERMDFGALEIRTLSLPEDQNARETTSSSSSDSHSKEGGITEPVVFAAKSHKKISSKDSPRTSLNSLNKFKSQIKKPSHRNGSPLNWIPRQKGDTYLKRKIQQLQEASGMNSTLDETLGTANPHYCRVLREKIASRQAAFKAMEARKAAMVEASWCRILKAARIQSKDAETLLLKAEKNATEALDAATAKGVMMYDTIDCTQKPYVIETSSTKGKPFAQSLKAPLETAFEVDRQVASAVKTAFIRLAANCPSLNKDEYSGLLMKISENPESDETSQDLSDLITSECESDAGLKFELGSEDSSLSVNQMDEEIKFGMFGRRQSPQNCTKESLDDIMLGRLKCLKEEELASLATIVATCGLNAALAEMENQHQDRNSYASCNSRRISTYGSRRLKNSSMDCLTNELPETRQSDVELPSLDKCLIKHMTKLEREVQDARNARKNDPKGGQENPVKSNKSNVTEVASSEAKHEPGLESILVKHSSKLEKEKAELKRKIGQIWELDHKEQPGEEGQIRKGGHGQVKQKVDEVPSLDKFLVKRVSRLEREVQEAKSRRNDESAAPGSLANNVLKKGHTANQLEENRSLPCLAAECTEKENIDLNSNDAVHTEKDLIVKKAAEIAQQEFGNLDSFLVKHKSKLEREKMGSVQLDYDQPKHSLTRQKAREKEMQDAWGGMSLGNCVRPHLSRLEREKAAWIKAEEEKKTAICVNRALP